MKFLVTVTPGPMPPPIELIQPAQDWVQARLDDGSFECAYAFPDGGGLSIGNNDSHEQLMDQLLEYPLSPFVSYDVRPLVGLDDAFDRFKAFAEKMQQMTAAQA